MRFARFLAPLLTLVSTLALHAQVEPNLMTTTDLSDVYKSKSGQSTLVLIYDFTASSRAIFESVDYLTNKHRRAYLDKATGGGPMGSKPQPSDASSFDPTVFAKPGRKTGPVDGIALNTTTPILGYVFVMQASAADGDPVNIRMYTWPSGSPLTVRTTVGNTTEAIGRPVCYSGTGTTMDQVMWKTDVLTTLKNSGKPVTHVRFTINGRTVDLPCPWRIHDSPSYVTQPTQGTQNNPFPAIQLQERNYQKNLTYQTGYTGIPFDTYSDLDSSSVRNLTASSYGSGNDRVIGQFYYTPDYLSWIFYGTTIRGDYTQPAPSKGGEVSWKANPYGNASGASVPTTSDKYLTSSINAAGTTVYTKDATLTSEGFANHLPNLTRFQAQKVATISAFLDKVGKASFIYRYLAPGYGDADNDEELTATAYAKPATYRVDRAGAETSITYLSDLRSLTLALLQAKTSSLQNMPPKDLTGTQSKVNSDIGNSDVCFDAYTPQPTAVALANTYRKIVRNDSPNPGVSFGSGECSGGVFVVPLAGNMMNDSLTTLGDQNAAYVSNSAGYYSYTHGNTGLSKGGSNYPDASITAQMAAGTFVPGSDYFHPAVMGASAAFGLTGVTNNAANYDAPWNDATTKKGRSIQTMAISLAVPGTYVNASDNNGRNPHEEFFDLAQWSNPSNQAWSASNPAPSKDLIYYYRPTNSNNVRYFPTADPAALEAVIKNITSYIVFGKAALSAPATPATGVQNANQAYFGTFQTTSSTDEADKVPVWAGNIYSIGLQRVSVSGTAAGSVQQVFQFYGQKDDGTNDYATVNNAGTNTADFDVLNLWSAYTIFGRYQDTSHPGGVNTTKLLAGDAPEASALLWKERTAYIFNGTNGLETYIHSANGSTDNATQLKRIIGWIEQKDATDTYYLSTTVKAGTSPTEDTARDMMRFLLGAFDPEDNDSKFNRDKADLKDDGKTLYRHLNVMGDIVNSAPQAVELSKDLASKLPDVVVKDPFFTAAYGSDYTDPHTRLIIVGTNTGHLHCFVEVAAKHNLATDTTTYGYYQAKATELWTFLAPNLFPVLWDMYNNKSETDITKFKHRYAVDGDPVLYHDDKPPTGSVLGDTRVGLNEDAAIVFGFRKGARDYFSLAIATEDGKTTPDQPKLAFWVQPLTGDIITGSGTTSDFQELIRTMGASTCVPTFGYVHDKEKKLKHSVFLSGGYANAEIDKRYLNDDAIAGTSYFQLGMGRLILPLNPMTGEVVRTNPWDLRKLTGAIPGGVAPTEIINLGTGLTHRLYFGDFNGSVWSINSSGKASDTSFRADDNYIDNWIDEPRLIYSDSKVRFTTAPDAYRLPGDFPIPHKVGTSPISILTAMVSIGSGDRNNPIDAPEDFSYVNEDGETKSVTQDPAEYNQFYVFADLQNASAAIPTSKLMAITSTWATSYSDAKVTAGTSSYLWGNYDLTTNTGSDYHYGYYVPLPYNDATNPYLAPAADSANRTRDKMMVSPLIKQGSIFYSFFNVYGSSGFGCSPFATTRTFRQCDILRPLYYNPQIDLASATVSDVQNSLDRNSDTCSGLAFSFNSLSSQMVDAGDYVMQGGAKASTAEGVKGSNTPDIQAVKDTGANRGFRLKSWRVIR